VTAGPPDGAPVHRLARLRAAMEAGGWDAVVASGAAHVAHLAGYARYYSGPAAILVQRDGRRTLFLPHSESRAATADGVDEVVGYGAPGFGLEPDAEGALAAAVAERVEELESVAAAGAIAHRLGPDVADAGEVLAVIRRQKDRDELERILTAYELCWTGQQAIADAAAAGAPEIELFSAAQSAAQRAHGAPVEFVCDALAGRRTADVCCPAAVAGATRPAAGEPVLADVSLCAAGYWGDTADTHLAVGDGVAADLRAGLLEILDATAADLRPGCSGAEVFGALGERIADRFPDGEFPHHGGHGLGTTAHEPPHLVPAETATLDEWQVIALEPGVYLPGRVGARIEELYLVTAEGGVELRTAFGRPRGLAAAR
jgi:Xaa-Pro aminopeptidase